MCNTSFSSNQGSENPILVLFYMPEVVKWHIQDGGYGIIIFCDPIVISREVSHAAVVHFVFKILVPNHLLNNG